ncbi:helix-turn-helix domain-containing protein [Streptomyces sp. NPDC006134]|uniref:helix-turn-helix domain-containing protein n=1 Tax=Streptomyces sp. NPDC006134 TaxID=3154467 RepID=UPI0033FCEBA8
MPRWKPLPEGTDPSVRQLVGQLRRLKDRGGLSLAALEAKTGCSRSSWERYLNGHTLPPQRAVESLCELSGADPVRLLALREVAETVWPASSTGGEDTAGPTTGPEPVTRTGVRASLFALVVTAAFVVAATAGALLGLKPWQEAQAATRPAPVRCDVRSEDGALHAGHSRTWKKTIALGYAGEAVAEAECLLGYHGYDTGRVDGLYDIATRNAARRAQRDAGEVPDGIVGRHTWPVLRREW